MISRRRILQGFAGGLSAAALTRPGLSLARLAGERRLVVVVLRGGLDGLAALPPFGDPDYRRARGYLSLPAPGSKDSMLDLDGSFALHPSLTALHEMYRNGELVAVHAAGRPTARARTSMPKTCWRTARRDPAARATAG